MGAAKRLFWVVLALGAVSASAQQKQMQIQFAEKVQLKATSGHSEFDAYGRRFSLELEPNDRLLAILPEIQRTQLAGTELMRGKLDGAPGSWVRLTQMGASLEGAIWDGHDLYVVSSLARIAKNLTTPIIDAAPGQTVVYRLSDTLNSLPEAFCGLEDRSDAEPKSGVSGLKQYQALVAQLAATVVPSDQLEIALVADTSFQQASTTPRETMLFSLNIVDGIFAEQIHVLLSPTEFRLVSSDSDPFTATDASRLLEQLATYREQSPELRTAGLTHLFTNKDLDGDTIGIAYLDSLCDPRRGVSLSDIELGFLNSALVMAHEIGHNFGAEHDGSAGGACAATEYGYVMWPTFNGSSTFSQCSRSSMLQSVARARGICISAPIYADLSVAAPAVIDANTNVEFTLPVTVRSLGNIAARDAKLRMYLPTSEITFRGAVLSNGACAVTDNLVECSLGDIPAATDRVVELKLVSTRTVSITLETSVSATNDHLRSNSVAQTNVRFSSAVDLKLAMSVTPESAYATDPFEVTLDVTSLRSQAAHGGQIWVTLGSLKFDSATAGAHICTNTTENGPFGGLRCDLADVLSGATTRIVLHVHGETRGSTTVSAQVQVAGDGDSSNNYATDSVLVISENDLPITASRDSLRFVPGTIQQVTFTITAIGRIPVVDAEFWVSPPWNGTLDSVVPSAGTCPAVNAPATVICHFGDLSPGTVLTVVVRFHTTANGGSILGGQSIYHLNPNLIRGNSAVTQLYSNLLIDAVASALFSSAVEGQPGSAFAGIESVGLQPAQNVVATIEVPAPVRLTAMNVTNANNWACSLLTAQRARCTGAFADVGGASITYAYISNAPGDYVAKLTISADGDLNASNNTSEATLNIGPYLDVGITTSETQMQLVAGQDHVVGFTVTTGVRAVPGVILVASYGPDIDSMTAAGVACLIDSNGNGRCDLGDLPANASIPVAVTYRTTRDDVIGTATVYALTSVDRNQANNSASISYTTIAYTDVSLQLAQTTATTMSGTRLTFPRVTVTAVGAFAARSVVVQIPLAAFTTVESVSGGGVICTGTSILRCEVFPFQPGETRTIDIVLNTSGPGTFTSNVTLQSANDSTAGNNGGAVELSVTAQNGGGGSSGGGSSSGGGGGGGGRFEWLALAFLGLLATWRARRPHSTPRYVRPLNVAACVTDSNSHRLHRRPVHVHAR